MRRPLLVIVILAIAVGAVFRFVALGDKLYTNDEATTSVHVSGHTIADYLNAAAAGSIRTTGDALRFQTLDPATSVRDVVDSLAVEDPQHPPLYYVLARGWERALGTSIPMRRALSAVVGLLVLAAAFSLGCELFRTRAAGLLLAATVAVSPFHVLYAQQAREYSLWTLFVLLSSTLLLRALESQAPAEWIGYALAVTLGLYTDTLFLYTLASQTAFVLLLGRTRSGTPPRAFFFAAAASFLAFVPWLVVLIRGRALVTNNAYFGAPLPAKLFALKWLFNVGAVFFDLDYAYHVAAVALVPIVAALLYGWLLLLRDGPRRSALLTACLFAGSSIAFVLPDLLRHESRSTSSRYLVPAWIACEIAMTYLLVRLASSGAARARLAGAAAFCALAVAGLWSCWVGMHRSYWWGDASIAPIGAIARELRAAPKPVALVFSDDHTAWDFGPMELAETLPPDVRLVLLSKDASLRPPLPAKSVFALDPSANFVRRLDSDGWHPTLSYRFSTQDPLLRGLREQAARTRASAGVADEPASLWRLRNRAGLQAVRE